MWLRVTEWPTVTPWAVQHPSGQKKLYFHLLDLAILSGYIIHVAVRKVHMEIFDISFWGVCWHMLEQNGERQCH